MLKYSFTPIIVLSALLLLPGACSKTNNNKYAPEFASVPEPEAGEGLLYNYEISCTDRDGNDLTVVLGPLDTCGGELTVEGGTGTYSFTPDETQGGTECTMDLLCSDGKHEVPQTQLIALLETNSAPVLPQLPTTVGVHLENSGTYALTAEDSDDPANVVTLSIDASACSFEVVLNGGNEVAWTCPDTLASCDVQVTATDDGSPVAESTATLTLDCTNDLPVYDSTPVLTMDEETTYVYDVACSDPNEDVVSLDIGVADTCGGLLDPVGGSTGTYMFDTTETDGGTTCTVSFACTDIHGGVGVQTFDVTIAETNKEPMITNLPASVQTIAETAGSMQLTFADDDLPAQTMSWQITNNTCTFTPSVNANGNLSWICNLIEVCSVTVTVTDSGSPALSASGILDIACIDGGK